MHGVGFTSGWETTDLTPTGIGLALRMPTGDAWPFGGSVAQRFDVFAEGLDATMTVTADDRAFPVSFGWHPWFRKPELLRFAPTAMYRRDEHHIAVDELVDVPPGPWDDCFVNHEPVGLRIDGVDVELESPCTHWVVFDERRHATCVEPQTGPPDAFTIRPEVLEPGSSMSASFRLRRVDTPDEHPHPPLTDR
jgi:aldose 1-epimerase